MADIDDFDIDRSIAPAWAEFQARLSEVISMIDESADLTIGTGSGDDDAAPFLRLSSPRRASGPRARRPATPCWARTSSSVPNSSPPWSGWAGSRPTATVTHPTGNFWVELSTRTSADRISELAVAALRDVYGVQHPIFLAPDQLAEVLQPDPTPVETSTGALVPTGRRPSSGPTMPRNRQHLDELVDAELSRDVRPPADARRRRRCRHPGRAPPCSSCGPRRTRRRW